MPMLEIEYPFMANIIALTPSSVLLQITFPFAVNATPSFAFLVVICKIDFLHCTNQPYISTKVEGRLLLPLKGLFVNDSSLM
jgi:hypothetical protein